MALVRTEYDINSFLELIRYTVRTRASFPDPPPNPLVALPPVSALHIAEKTEAGSMA